MNNNLFKIKAKRLDITDWVIHWTHRQEKNGKSQSPWDVLTHILKCGYLKPSYALRTVNTSFGRADLNTIRGNYPAVCFSEQPLSAFVTSYLADGRKYPGCGIAFEKRHLFQYGGRPVIYGDEKLLDRLQEEDKYLWVKYDPLNQPSRDYSIDWTHEREWRAKVSICTPPGWGPTPEEGIPLILPPIDDNGKSLISFPLIIVINSTLVENLRDSLKIFSEYKGTNSYIKHLYENYDEQKILPLDMVYEKLEASDERWGRLDTIPFEDIL